MLAVPPVLGPRGRRTARYEWIATPCSEYSDADGRLMPAKKNQAPPDRRYFKRYRGKIAPHRTNGVPVAREHAHGPVRVKKAGDG